jgi:hypothetical protein
MRLIHWNLFLIFVNIGVGWKDLKTKSKLENL